MKIAGLQKMTLIDYPGKLATTVFTLGCNFRCPFCHNPELVSKTQGISLISEEQLLEFLKSRQKYLDAVCFTGGEPLLHEDIIDILKKVKDKENRMEIAMDMIQQFKRENIKFDYINFLDSIK